jgi:hypothetical protein
MREFLKISQKAGIYIVMDPLIYKRSEAFTAVEVDKISGYQPCQLVKTYRCFRDGLCPHHQGLM